MGNFVPFLTQTSPQIAARLQDFQSQTLLGLLPIDPKASAADKEMEDIMDESMGPNLQNMLIDELPVVNSRAGLYIWLSSLVCTAMKILT